MKLQNMKRGETTEQITLFNWAENNKHILPCLSLMYHIPNEGNQNLALLVKGQQLTVKQSAAVLTVAMEAYKRAEKKGD